MADLWQDVKKSVDKLTTTINVKSKEVVQVSKVKKEIDELNDEMTRDGFWGDQKDAQKTINELNGLRAIVEQYQQPSLSAQYILQG